jgi:hypothetical protein
LKISFKKSEFFCAKKTLNFFLTSLKSVRLKINAFSPFFTFTQKQRKIPNYLEKHPKFHISNPRKFQFERPNFLVQHFCLHCKFACFGQSYLSALLFRRLSSSMEQQRQSAMDSGICGVSFLKWEKFLCFLEFVGFLSTGNFKIWSVLCFHNAGMF